jgi:inorganic pyrophosphatase
MYPVKSIWHNLDKLIAEHKLVIDRPAGSAHPTYADMIYPYDYGYLEGTKAADGGGIDVWIGSYGGGQLTGVMIAVDMLKRDVEIKLLLGCSPTDVENLLEFLRSSQMAVDVILR